MSDRPRALIADGHAAARIGVRLSLEQGGFDVCGEAADAAELVELALRHRPDICVLDVAMPGGGIAAVETIARGLPETRIAVLTGSADEGDLFAAVSAGANGYLLKDTDPDRLPLALRGVLAGDAALPRALMLRIIDEFRERTPSAGAGEPGELTARESAVLELLRADLATSQIAHRLGISPVTVRRHVSQIVRKLGVADRRAAAAVPELD